MNGSGHPYPNGSLLTPVTHFGGSGKLQVSFLCLLPLVGAPQEERQPAVDRGVSVSQLAPYLAQLEVHIIWAGLLLSCLEVFQLEREAGLVSPAQEVSFCMQTSLLQGES